MPDARLNCKSRWTCLDPNRAHAVRTTKQRLFNQGVRCVQKSGF